MKIIPAIDIMNRQVVRLEKGEFDRVKVYSDNPVSVARRWKSLGATMLHIVDLDGARDGKAINIDIVSKIALTEGLITEFGGGLRTEADIDNAFQIGVNFAVLGTSAVGDEDFLKLIIGKFGKRVVFAIDIKNGKVAVKGWQESSSLGAAEYVKTLERLGARRIIYTDISKDGMMVGPNLKGLEEILNSTSMDVIVSGGVSSVEDIKKLKPFEEKGLFGIIMGKALYEGTVDLKEALSVS